MSSLDDLIASRDRLLEWVEGVAPVVHAMGKHRGEYNECGRMHCADARAATTEAYRVADMP